MSAEQMSQGPHITLHWLDGSRAQRFVWLFEELKISYDIKVWKRKNKYAPKELKDIHPLGKSPIVEIKAPNLEKPLILVESGNIAEYVIDHFGGQGLVPQRYPPGKEGQVGAETEGWLRYRQFMHYAEGSLMTPLIVWIIVDSIRNAPVPFPLSWITGNVADKVDSAYLKRNFETHFGYLEEQLATSPNSGEYLCGKELTGADILMGFPLEAASTEKAGLITASTYPKLYAYVERLHQREAYQRAIKAVEDVTREKYSVI